MSTRQVEELIEAAREMQQSRERIAADHQREQDNAVLAESLDTIRRSHALIERVEANDLARRTRSPRNS